VAQPRRTLPARDVREFGLCPQPDEGMVGQFGLLGMGARIGVGETGDTGWGA